MKQLNIRPTRFACKTDGHFKRYGLENWWEQIGYVGDGTLKQELESEIEEGIEEYKVKLKDDQEDYNKLITKGIKYEKFRIS